MYALRAETNSGRVVGYYICGENDIITHAWENPVIHEEAGLRKLVSDNPFALFVLAEKMAAEWGLERESSILG